jgi:hypothetical protein
MHPQTRHRLAALSLAAAGLFAASAAQAATATYPVPSGDIMDVPMELQAQAAKADHDRVVAEALQAPVSEVKPSYDTTFTPATTVGPLSRAEVREALFNARAAGMQPVDGEAGHTTETLQAQEAFNQLQAEVITARWNDEARVMAQAYEAERAALIAQQEIEAVMAMSERREEDTDPLAANGLAPGESLVEPTAEPARPEAVN